MMQIGGFHYLLSALASELMYNMYSKHVLADQLHFILLQSFIDEWLDFQSTPRFARSSTHSA